LTLDDKVSFNKSTDIYLKSNGSDSIMKVHLGTVSDTIAETSAISRS
jgi:hypothetical protein